MEFRPCIDIHNGKVKQIVGSSLDDETQSAKENFATDRGSRYYAGLYRSYGLSGGHVINLNKAGSMYYEASKAQVMEALNEYPQHLMAGGGINAGNASEYIDAGASHVIVTSYVFSDGVINDDNLQKLVKAVGAGRIVLDLSCVYTDNGYRVATDRWQKISDETVDERLFDRLGSSCDEFLVHAVGSEGRSAGIDERLVSILARSEKKVCYAGGISSYDDIRRLKETGDGRVDFTVGSALEIFGGSLGIEEIIECIR